MPEKDLSLWNSIGQAIAAVIIGAYGMFKGIKIFGKKKELQGCPDVLCHSEVLRTAQEVDALKANFKDFERYVETKINPMSDSIARIEGYVKGLHDRPRSDL